MPVKRLQNRIAESRTALPVVALYALAVCVAGGFAQSINWLNLLLVAAAAAIVVELNNANSLLRVYSRMVPCAFLALAALCATLLSSSFASSALLACFAAFFILIFNTYQNRTAAAFTFYAFACIGIASTMFVQILFLVPVMWILQATNLQSMSGKTFSASLLGLAAPYWFAGGYFLYAEHDAAEILMQHFAELADFGQPFYYADLTPLHIATFLWIVLLSLLGIVHSLQTGHADKTRTRLIYGVFITLNLCSMLFIVLQPRHFALLTPLLIVTAAPLAAHFIALTHSLLSSIVFYFIMAATLALTVLNLWMQ